jgi:hypothetical protein
MRLINFLLIAFVCCVVAAGQAFAVKDPPAVPVTPVESAQIAPQGLTVVELFSSQACVFCPRADRLFADLIEQPNIIGLACHVDYFDVRAGALSTKFCTERQKKYMNQLRAGPPYTPQIVVNGHTDAVGYKVDVVSAAMRQEATNPAAIIAIEPDDTTAGSYRALFPALPAGHYQVWLFPIDKPHETSIAEGQNRGNAMSYVHIVRTEKDLGAWGGQAATVRVKPEITDAHTGFAVIAQDSVSGRIVAAGYLGL